MNGPEYPALEKRTVNQGEIEAVGHALRTYMDQDECVCEPEGEPCPSDCQRCMWCKGYTALKPLSEEPSI